MGGRQGSGLGARLAPVCCQAPLMGPGQRRTAALRNPRPQGSHRQRAVGHAAAAAFRAPALAVLAGPEWSQPDGGAARRLGALAGAGADCGRRCGVGCGGVPAAVPRAQAPPACVRRGPADLPTPLAPASSPAWHRLAGPHHQPVPESPVWPSLPARLAAGRRHARPGQPGPQRQRRPGRPAARQPQLAAAVQPVSGACPCGGGGWRLAAGGPPASAHGTLERHGDLH